MYLLLLFFLIPLLIMLSQISVILQYRKLLRPMIVYSLLLTSFLPMAASAVQHYFYGLSLSSITIVGTTIMLYIIALIDVNGTAQQAKDLEIRYYQEEQKHIQKLFGQTAEALASAIDAKDKYTHGHSTRVAEYSKDIAEKAGKSPQECQEIYFTALLHDVGKIGIPDQIINKDGKLTDEEFALIKKHPEIGNRILSRISESPYLSIGAHYHHERYDGHGYPEGLKGEDIPEIARIIGVADAYDAMTSKRSYRDPIPQQKVREELVKGMGTQFDPEFAKIMLHMIDLDTEYWMQEKSAPVSENQQNRLHCGELFQERSEGVLITDHITRVTFSTWPDVGFSGTSALPTLVLFDALDGRVHRTEAKRKDLLYLEYAQFRIDGQLLRGAVRNAELSVRHLAPGERDVQDAWARGTEYEVETVKVKDHLRVTVTGPEQVIDVILALPDSSRFVYLSLTGEHCVINNIQSETDGTPVPADAIPRIAEEISFIADSPVGDVPNVQIDGWRSASSRGFLLDDTLTITFHTQSLPTARLVWHCPFVSIFTSDNGQTDGGHYHEFSLVRLDGENWESDEQVKNELLINKTADFPGWNAWKEKNREGMDCTITARREKNVVTLDTENLGINIRCVTTLQKKNVDRVYLSLTGDQCALTDIRAR